MVCGFLELRSTASIFVISGFPVSRAAVFRLCNSVTSLVCLFVSKEKREQQSAGG